MNRIGQVLTAFGTADAPQFYTGECTSFSEDRRFEETLDTDAAGDNRALILDREAGELSMEGKVSAASTDFLDLSTGPLLTVAAYNTGAVLAYDAEEYWALGAPKTATVRAKYAPHIVIGGGGGASSAGVTLSAFTPDQSALTTVTPGGVLIWGTYGMTQASGVLHGLRLRQMLTLTFDDPAPNGEILGVAWSAYVRRLEIEVLAKAAAPDLGAVLVIENAPDHASGFKVTGKAKTYRTLKGLMYRIPAIWIEAFAGGEEEEEP